MLTGKQRAHLRKLANGIDTIFQIGKGGLGEPLIIQINDALEARELVKIRVLDTANDLPRRLCGEVCEATGAEPVLVIGSRFVVYKPSKKQPKIQLD